MCSAYDSWKKRGGDLIGQEEEPIKRPLLDVYNEPDKGGERWEPFWCPWKWRCQAWQGRRECRCYSVSRNFRQLAEELRVIRQKFAPKCLEERQEGSQVWWRKAQQRQPWFHFGNIHLRRRRCRSFFATRSKIGRVCAVALARRPELYWLAICTSSSLGKLSRVALSAKCRGEARRFKERREGGENVKCWHKKNYDHTAFQRDVR